jgi:Flp pilus assembly protein TadB
VSKERAQRRAERERTRSVALAEQARRDAVRAERRRRRNRLRAAMPQRTRVRRQQGVLARRRRAQNLALLGVFLVSQLLVWLVTDDWWLRLGAAVLTLLALPVVATLAFDRRT